MLFNFIVLACDCSGRILFVMSVIKTVLTCLETLPVTSHCWGSGTWAQGRAGAPALSVRVTAGTGPAQGPLLCSASFTSGGVLRRTHHRLPPEPLHLPPTAPFGPGFALSGRASRFCGRVTLPWKTSPWLPASTASAPALPPHQAICHFAPATESNPLRSRCSCSKKHSASTENQP